MLRMIFDEVFPKLSEMTIEENGDDFEKSFFPDIADKFPNFQKLWQLLVIPTTHRIYFLSDFLENPCIRRNRQDIESSTCNPFSPSFDWAAFEEKEKLKPTKIDTRPEVSKDVKNLGLIHYSILLHLKYSWSHIKSKSEDYLEDALVHLASIMDLVEEFATHIQLLFCRANKIESHSLQKLTENEFVELAKEWYEEFYPNTFEYYQSKGKFRSISIPCRKNIVHEFFQKEKTWKNFENFFIKIKTYRNKLVHAPFMLNVKYKDAIFVPTLGKILDYQHYDLIREATKKKEVFDRDFLLKEAMIESTYEKALIHLNSIWPYFYNVFQNMMVSRNEIFLDEIGFPKAV